MTSNRIPVSFLLDSVGFLLARASVRNFEVFEFSIVSNWPKLNEDLLKFFLIAAFSRTLPITQPNKIIKNISFRMLISCLLAVARPSLQWRPADGAVTADSCENPF